MNALLLVDKRGGMTSHDVVARVRRLTGEKSVGHLGTLDPMATGLLPLLLGKWTRLAKFYGSLPKTYTGIIRFGYATDTYDAEGVQAGEQIRPEFSLETLQTLAKACLGRSEQMPPAFSAKKVGGKAAYTLARAGIEPALRAVPITIDAFTIDSLCMRNDGTADASFLLRISSGGYVRSVAHALGEQLGCGAHLAALRRIAAGPLLLEHALSLHEIEDLTRSSTLESAVPHPRTLLPELPAVTADAMTVERVRHGSPIVLPEFSRAGTVRVFASQGELIAIADRVAGLLFQPKVVLI